MGLKYQSCPAQETVGGRGWCRRRGAGRNLLAMLQPEAQDLEGWEDCLASLF